MAAILEQCHDPVRARRRVVDRKDGDDEEIGGLRAGGIGGDKHQRIGAAEMRRAPIGQACQRRVDRRLVAGDGEAGAEAALQARSGRGHGGERAVADRKRDARQIAVGIVQSDGVAPDEGETLVFHRADRDRQSGCGRQIGERDDVERQDIRGRVEIDAALRRAAGVAQLEAQCRVGVAIAIRQGREDQLPGVKRRAAHLLAGQDRDPTEGQHALGRQAGDPQRRQRVPIDIREPEIRRVQHMAAILDQPHRAIGPRRRIVHRRDDDGDLAGGFGTSPVDGQDRQRVAAIEIGVPVID